MEYVYLISDEVHGLYCICANKDKATEIVDDISHGCYGLPKETKPDYDNENCYGYDGAASWKRVEVV